MIDAMASLQGIFFKRRIRDLLTHKDIDHVLAELCAYPSRKIVSPLIACLFSSDEAVKWHAVTALGLVVNDIAATDFEAARIIMRRFMWSLNDESGGIGWGAPEAMAEIMVCHEGLAMEYGHILVSYMREDGNMLEHVPLQRGLMWGIGRLAGARRELMLANRADRYLSPYLDSEDAVVKGLAAFALGMLKAEAAQKKLKSLLPDQRRILLFSDRRLMATTVGNIAGQVLKSLSTDKEKGATV